MIKVEKLQAQVRLLPLLFKDVELRHIGLAGVDVLFETDSNGQGNWDFTAGDKSGKSAGAFESIKIDIDSIRIENLSLALRKGKTRSAKRITLARLDMAKQGSGDAQTFDLRTQYNGQPVTLKGTTGSIHQLLNHERFPVQLSGKFSNAAVNIDGAIDDILNLAGIDLKLNGPARICQKLGRSSVRSFQQPINLLLRGD